MGGVFRLGFLESEPETGILVSVLLQSALSRREVSTTVGEGPEARDQLQPDPTELVPT